MRKIELSVMIMSIVAMSLLTCVSCKKQGAAIPTNADFQKKTQEALINAKPGSVVALPAGKFQLDRSLSLSVENVTIRGQGMDKTILSFKGQKTGAEGLLVTAGGI